MSKKLQNPEKDCFAYDRVHKTCTCLETSTCEDCKFFKTWEQFEKDAEYARGLLRAKGDFNLVSKYL